MSAKMRVQGFHIEVKHGDWTVEGTEQEREQAAPLLDVIRDVIHVFYVGSGSDLNPDLSKAKIVEKEMGGEILSFDVPPIVPGRLY